MLVVSPPDNTGRPVYVGVIEARSLLQILDFPNVLAAWEHLVLRHLEFTAEMVRNLSGSEMNESNDRQSRETSHKF
jgi:hypothetical protein